MHPSDIHKRINERLPPRNGDCYKPPGRSYVFEILIAIVIVIILALAWK